MSAIDLKFTLDDVYTRDRGRLYMTGIQALVRLPMMQRRLDRARGLSTAGLVSGYRGSPLGAYDQQLWRAERHLAADDILFQPGLNEDLAATALWGAQMHSAFGERRVDGVFGVWYGKGPGVDRSGDVLRNANMLGTSALGGVLALAGDDHAAQSSMFPHQTDGIFQSVGIPILQPASVNEILELGLAGFALSRHAGVWVAMKTIAEVVESSASFEAPAGHPTFDAPSDLEAPPHGYNWDPGIPWPAGRAELERRLIEERLPAVRAWTRANGLDRLVQDAPRRRLLVVTVGKAHQDLMEALQRLEAPPARAAALGVAIYKVAVSWPLETAALERLVAGSEQVLVVEEKRGIVEDQLKAALFNVPADRRAPVIGKRDLAGAPLLPETSELNPLLVARALVTALSEEGRPLRAALARWEDLADRPPPPLAVRRPFFCAGCPHNSSTRTPEGSIAGGGIGCHVMALAEPALKTTTFSQMGGEGVQWVGAAPFVKTAHIFQNLGDGTYQHSGLLAVRAAVAAGTNITFKILYNDAVAMTGGQPAEGAIDPARITRQLAAEGVGTIVLVSDDPDRWTAAEGLADGVRVAHRDQLDAIQRELREVAGATAILYEQTCASEKRRRRKRGAYPDPDRRLVINPRVCEGCGDCQAQSNCIAVEPVATPFGTKRRINQGACNKDFSCLKGFCPSFVEIEGAELRKPDARGLSEAGSFLDALPTPQLPVLADDFNILIAGVGGTGVLTLGALLGVAAHVEGLAASTLDFTGLAQKNGAVTSQVRIAADAARLHAVRMGEGAADLLLAADLVVAASPDALLRMSASTTRAALSEDVAPTADAVTRRDAVLPLGPMRREIERRTRSVETLRATGLAEALFGEPTTANTLLLGFAWQKGWLPLSEAALLRAIEVNGVAVEANRQAFRWGRAAACDLQRVETLAGLRAAPGGDEALDALVERLAADLTAYQDARYAARFQRLVAEIRAAEARTGRGEALARTVAVQAHRLMAYKDEYEVARLHVDAAFGALVTAQFAAPRRVSIWLAPPFLSRPDPRTGRPAKRRFGPWIWPALRLLAKGKVLRGTRFDPFGRTEERRAERALVETYFDDVAAICRRLGAETHDRAVELAAWPSEARGFGPVKAEGMARARAGRERLRSAFEASEPPRLAAE